MHRWQSLYRSPVQPERALSQGPCPRTVRQAGSPAPGAALHGRSKQRIRAEAEVAITQPVAIGSRSGAWLPVPRAKCKSAGRGESEAPWEEPAPDRGGVEAAAAGVAPAGDSGTRTDFTGGPAAPVRTISAVEHTAARTDVISPGGSGSTGRSQPANLTSQGLRP